MTWNRFIFCVVVVAVCAAFIVAPKAGGASPSDIAQKFQATLLAVMKDAETLNVKERYDRLAPSIDDSFHVPLMIQIAAGQHWAAATPSERAELVMAFRRMSIATLATLFSSYSGEVFELVKQRPGPQNTQVVMTKLIKSDKSEVDIAYVSRQFKEGWRLIDVIVDNGISELKVRRSEYRQVLMNEGIPGLITLLNRKADELVGK